MSGIMYLKDFHHLALRKDPELRVTVEVHETVPVSSSTGTQHEELYKELEDTLLNFSQVQLVLFLDLFPSRISSVRVKEVERCFSGLFQRGALKVVPNTSNSKAPLLLYSRWIDNFHFYRLQLRP